MNNNAQLLELTNNNAADTLLPPEMATAPRHHRGGDPAHGRELSSSRPRLER